MKEFWAKLSDAAWKATEEAPNDDLAERYEFIARRVVAAMSEPTEAMELAGIVAIQEADDGAGESWDYVGHTWVAMIKAALKE